MSFTIHTRYLAAKMQLPITKKNIITHQVIICFLVIPFDKLRNFLHGLSRLVELIFLRWG